MQFERALLALGRDPLEQFVHLADRTLQGRDHVGLEFGIARVALGVAADQAQLADQILDVVENEGETAVEILEPLGVDQRVLAMRLGQVRRRLAPGGAEQVEILPVEIAGIFGRRQHHQPAQLALMDQRNPDPRVKLGQQVGRDRQHGVAGIAPAIAASGEIEDPAFAFDRPPE